MYWSLSNKGNLLDETNGLYRRTTSSTLQEFSLRKRNWLSYGKVHWSHPEDCLCWTNSNTCTIRDASFRIENKCLTSLPAFDWFYSTNIWSQSCTNFYA